MRIHNVWFGIVPSLVAGFVPSVTQWSRPHVSSVSRNTPLAPWPLANLSATKRTNEHVNGVNGINGIANGVNGINGASSDHTASLDAPVRPWGKSNLTKPDQPTYLPTYLRECSCHNHHHGYIYIYVLIHMYII